MWSNLDNKSRTSLLIAIAVLSVITVIALMLVFSSSKSHLFTGLDEKEAANVIKELEEMKVPYDISKGGKNILVDEKIAEEVRIKLIGKGVKIQSGQGFELFDDADIGMTEYSQKINYLRAMQGELARSIMSIDGIKYARVHLVLPETSVFKQNKQEPTASVTVIPEAGMTLSVEQISGIQRMVSASTPGVKQENVTVQDNKGVTLSDTQSENDGEQITSVLLKKKREAEAYLEDKVNIILNKAFGAGNSVATISVDLVVDKIHRKEEIVIPNASKNDGLLRKRETNSDVAKGKTGSGNKTIDVEYQLSKRIEEIISMPGAINRISVGILVPQGVRMESLENLKQVISMAVGLDSTRGDNVAIYPLSTEIVEKISDESVVVNAQPVNEDSIVVPAVEKTSGLENKLLEYVAYTQLVYIAAALIIFIVLLMLTLIVRSKSGKTIQRKELTIHEKEKLLTDLKSWVGEGAS